MSKMKRLKPMLALVLAVAMAMTGPAQSVGVVHADEPAAEETVSVETEPAESEHVDDAETQVEEQTQTVEETVPVGTEETEENRREGATETEPDRTSAEEEQTDIGTVPETLEENPTEPETDEEETTDVSDELKISGTEMNNALALSIGKNNITIRKDETGKWYYFEPEEDGAYYVELTDCSYECRLNISGVEKSLLDRRWEEYTMSELFIGKAGERVYFQPCFESWYDKEEDSENLKTEAVLEVRAAEKGTVSKDSEGKYTLSCGSKNFLLTVDTLNTTIMYQGSNKDKTDEGRYTLYAYCKGETYGQASAGYIYGESGREGCFSGLDMNETYHIDYVLHSGDNIFAYFNGEGEIFDLTTKDTDKKCGEIINVTADFATITIDYELFAIDSKQEVRAWIRYKKAGMDEWEDERDVYGDDEEDEDRTSGSVVISGVEIDMDTRYIIELVSMDKKTVYDSRQITTGKYEGKVTATVNQDSIKAQSVDIDITGYDAEDETIDMVRTEFAYTDRLGEIHRMSYTEYKSSVAFESGTITYQLNGLESETEYKDVKICMEIRSNHEWQWFYAGTVEFMTKASSIKKEDISAEITSTGLSNANAMVTVKGIPANEKLRLECKYRLKNGKWENQESAELTSDRNTVYFALNDLEEADYEFQFTIDGVTRTQDYHFTPKAVEGEAKATVKVTNTYVNAFEIEASLSGVAVDSEDVYTCHFQKYSYGRWYGRQEITLDPEKAVTNQIWCDSGAEERWRYVVFKNYVEYDIGYLDASVTRTKPLELDITSAETKGQRLEVTVMTMNWSDVLKEEEGRTYINALAQIRKKGEKKWESIGYGGSFGFDENGTAEQLLRICEYDTGYIIDLDPTVQYELRFVNKNDDSVVYGETTFKPSAIWEVPEENNFVYNSTNTRRSIAISDNYGTPTVEVENENIVSIREIRLHRIYLDVHNIGMTTLDVTADGITKTITVNVLPLAQMLFFFEGADETLKDLKLPEQYEWVNPAESPKADNENPIQYFDVSIREADGTKYGKVPVAVSTLDEDGIEIQGKDTIGFEKDGVYSVTCTGKGFVQNYYAEAQAYEITHEWTGDDGLEISEGRTERNATVKGMKAGGHELTLTVKVRNFQTGKILEQKKTFKINVLQAGLIDNIVLQPAADQPLGAIPEFFDDDQIVIGYIVTGSVVSGQVIDIDCENVDLSKNNQIRFEAKTDKGQKDEAGAPILEDIPVQWVSANEELLAVDGNGLVTIKGKGEGSLTITAEDDGRFSVPLIFRAYDKAPVFDSDVITVRDGNSEGTRLDYKEQIKNRVTGITLTGSDKLEPVKRMDNNDWYLRTKSGYTEETTEHITLKITTENGKTYDQALTVLVLPEPKVSLEANADAGTVTFSQTAVPNLFYVNSEAVFDVSDNYKDYEIEDIRTIEKDKDAQNFHVRSYNALEKTITFTANKLDTASVAAYTAKDSPNAVANVEVKFKGYDGYYPKDGKGISIKVAVQNKPVSALKAEDAFVTGSIQTASVDVLYKKTIFDLSGSSFEVVPAKTKAENITAAVENGSLKLTQTGETSKGGKYTFNVSNPNWTKVLTLTGKITKVDVSKLTVKASKTKATLNTKYNDSIKINVSVKGNASLPVVITTEVKPATDALAVKADEANKSITLGVAEGKTLATGKYTISVAGKVGEEKTKVTKITLTVTDKEPEVKLSAKGSINILNRDLSGITYTAAIKNTDAEIASVELTGDSVLRFKIVKRDGKQFLVKALRDAGQIDTKKPYEMKLKLTLSNGAVIKDTKGVTLKVKPVDKLPKVRIDAPKKPAISKTAKNGVVVKPYIEAGYQIDRIELDGKDKDKFDVEMNRQGAFTIRLAENADSIDSKAYSLKYKLYFVGANATTKQVTKSIKITVS